MTLIRRRKPKKMGIRQPVSIRCPGHLQFVRGCRCLVDDLHCYGKMAAHHVRKGAGAGMGEKPGDHLTVPLCVKHHDEVHSVGHDTFEQRYKLDLAQEAAKLWLLSPHGKKYRAALANST